MVGSLATRVFNWRPSQRAWIGATDRGAELPRALDILVQTLKAVELAHLQGNWTQAEQGEWWPVLTSKRSGQTEPAPRRPEDTEVNRRWNEA